MSRLQVNSKEVLHDPRAEKLMKDARRLNHLSNIIKSGKSLNVNQQRDYDRLARPVENNWIEFMQKIWRKITHE